MDDKIASVSASQSQKGESEKITTFFACRAQSNLDSIRASIGKPEEPKSGIKALRLGYKMDKLIELLQAAPLLTN